MLSTLADLDGATYGVLIGAYYATCWIMFFWFMVKEREGGQKSAFEAMGFGIIYFVALFLFQFMAAIICGNFRTVCLP